MMTESRALTEEGHLSFSDVIERSIQVARELLGILLQERQALAGAQHDALAPVFARKSALAGELSRLDVCRSKLVQAHGDALATGHPDWPDYCSVLADCREANAINGRLVQDRQRHVRRALGILRGQPDGDPELYSPRGATSQGPQSQDLGRA